LDWWGEDYYKASPVDDPTGPDSGEFRVVRGGSWGDSPWLARSANRHRNYPDIRFGNYGFRVSRTP
jgi:formylglycine-generating enzyme required for sulfatase activity